MFSGKGEYLMKTKNKALSLFIALVMIVMSLQTAYAADTKIYTDNISAEAGSTVSVPIRISGNTTGVSTFGIKIGYDSTVMTPKSGVTNGIYTSDIVFNPTYSTGKAFAAGASISNKTGEGTLFSIDFDINANAAAKSYPITIEVDELKYVSGSTTASIECTVVNGSIQVGGSTVTPPTDTADSLKIYCGSVSAKPGETVSVPINISGNESTGISTFGFKIGYDSSVLTPESNVTNGIFTNDIIFNPTYSNGVAFATGASAVNKTGDGTLFTVRFKVSDKAVSGKIYPITITVDELKYVSGTTINTHKYTTADGEVTINGTGTGTGTGTGGDTDIGLLYGDVDANGIISAADASLIMQKVLDGSFLFPVETK